MKTAGQSPPKFQKICSRNILSKGQTGLADKHPGISDTHLFSGSTPITPPPPGLRSSSLSLGKKQPADGGSKLSLLAEQQRRLFRSSDVLEPMDLNQSPGWDIVYLSWLFLYWDFYSPPAPPIPSPQTQETVNSWEQGPCLYFFVAS